MTQGSLASSELTKFLAKVKAHNSAPPLNLPDTEVTNTRQTSVYKHLGGTVWAFRGRKFLVILGGTLGYTAVVV